MTTVDGGEILGGGQEVRVSEAALQNGIYYKPGRRPPRFYALALLSAKPDATAASVADTLAELCSMYGDLRRGLVRDLQVEGHDPVRVPRGALRVLLGFGPKWFELPGNDPEKKPAALKAFSAPKEDGGGPIYPDAGISFANEVKSNPAEGAVLAVQFTAQTALAVERGIVETWKLLHDLGDDAPLDVDKMFAYTGTQRDDGRSWIDFHDGLSNILQENRERAIVIASDPAAPDADDWTAGGTYMSFIRLGIRLDAWRDLGRNDKGAITSKDRRAAQEARVGRDKLDGCPLTNGMVPAPGCPAVKRSPSAAAFSQGDPKDWLKPGEVLNAAVMQTHIRRANQRADLPQGRMGQHPIYRQGYPYLETFNGVKPFQAGLNFVSFQKTPGALFAILKEPAWLGQTNFGGNVGFTLTDAYAAGMFLVPPISPGERFPGESALKSVKAG